MLNYKFKIKKKLKNNAITIQKTKLKITNIKIKKFQIIFYIK